jgi:hypothetical protein
MVQGKIAEVELSARRAADGRHPPFITTATLPTEHPALPEGTLLFAGAAPGSAVIDDADTTLLGVLESAVEENEGTGNVVIHGSVPADILVMVADNGDRTPATAEQIKALRGIGIFV